MAPLEESMQTAEEQAQEKEERLYTAAQILLGNIKIPMPRKNVNNNNNNNSKENELQVTAQQAILVLDNDQPQPIETTANEKVNRNSLLEGAQKILKELQLSLESGAGCASITHHCNMFFASFNQQKFLKDDINDDDDDDCSSSPSVEWWKVLQGPVASAAHLQLANAFTEQALAASSYDGKQSELYETGNRHLMASLTAWPCNPAALSCLANLVRMGVLALDKHDEHSSSNNGSSTTTTAMRESLHFYLAAADAAASARHLAVSLLDSDDDDMISPDDKALVEGIVLNLCTQVHLMDDDQYSSSSVLSTASYMSALLASALGNHSLAFDVISDRFCNHGRSMTRIHPAVWKAASDATDNACAHPATRGSGVVTSCLASPAAFTPTEYRDAISTDFYKVLSHAFRPESSYWDESRYDRGVYYSFWIDWPLQRPKKQQQQLQQSRAHNDSSNESIEWMVVSNAVEHVIVEHLLPRVKSLLTPEKLATLAGFEWWVHTRPLGANVGHQLHFDTDEALLEQDGIVDFPMCASVLYLTVPSSSSNSNDDDNNNDDAHGHRYGATVIFDQTPEACKNAERAWIGVPRSRSFVVFPGDLLHGVLPCATKPIDDDDDQTTKPRATKPKTRKRKATRSTLRSPLPKPHRLTLMVNFWSRRIPDRLRKRKLYGPSGPFPPPTRSHSWVNEINQDYPRKIVAPSASSQNNDDNVFFSGQELGCASPAWETIEALSPPPPTGKRRKSSNNISSSSPVELPEGLNQRFFVRDAPAYFASTLHEK